MDDMAYKQELRVGWSHVLVVHLKPSAGRHEAAVAAKLLPALGYLASTRGSREGFVDTTQQSLRVQVQQYRTLRPNHFNHHGTWTLGECTPCSQTGQR